MGEGVGSVGWAILMAALLFGCNAKPAADTLSGSRYTTQTKAWSVIEDPAFGNFGRLIFPADKTIDPSLTLGEVGSLMTWYSEVNADKTVEIVNNLRTRALAGETVFYDLYSPAEKARDPAKKNTGLFFFRGKPGAKLAIVSAGGGFSYVAALHDSFPQALELSKRGLNACALIYRPGAQTACEDLARAIAFVHEHARELAVDPADYSLWGGSAGARMAAWLGASGTAAFGEAAYPRPAAVILQYTGLSEVAGTEPPTYACVGAADSIAPYRTMQDRIDRLKAQGTDAVLEVFEGLSHGFGLGEKTVAEGWLDRALAFWQRHAKPPVPRGLAHVPPAYLQPAARQGTLVELTYPTYESKTYQLRTKPLTKRAIVYLPPGYTKQRKYNVVYLMHGGWGNETSTLGTPDQPNGFKNVIDHAIENQEIEPLIVVCPTYNNESPQDSADYTLAFYTLTVNYHQELVNDLIPAVEGRYSTFAEGTNPEDLKRSRDHRAFGGFSMGSVATWYTVVHCLDQFRYFLPMSGAMDYEGDDVDAAVTASGHQPGDFSVFGFSGTEDFEFGHFQRQIEGMLSQPSGNFISTADDPSGNVSFHIEPGYSHDGRAAMDYTYTGLRWLSLDNRSRQARP